MNPRGEPHNLTHVSAEMQRCIAACLECQQVCLETVTHCLEKGGKHAAPDQVRTLLDCAEICQTSANFMSRGSEHHAETCGVCATICDACAESCEKMADDAQMKRCAEVCRRCADECEKMAGPGRKAA